MTRSEIKAFLVGIDPTIERYESSHTGSDAYTVWRELGPAPIYADGQDVGVMRFQVDRFTKTENDHMANNLWIALEDRDDIAFQYLVDYEPDTGYIHHIFDCEGC